MGGYLQALDEASGEQLWLLKVCDKQRQAGKEGDVQDVFFKSMTLQPNGNLLIEIGLTQNCPSKARCRRQYACTARQRNAAGAVLRKSYENERGGRFMVDPAMRPAVRAFVEKRRKKTEAPSRHWIFSPRNIHAMTCSGTLCRLGPLIPIALLGRATQ